MTSQGVAARLQQLELEEDVGWGEDDDRPPGGSLGAAAGASIPDTPVAAAVDGDAAALIATDAAAVSSDDAAVTGHDAGTLHTGSSDGAACEGAAGPVCFDETSAAGHDSSTHIRDSHIAASETESCAEPAPASQAVQAVPAPEGTAGPQ